MKSIVTKVLVFLLIMVCAGSIVNAGNNEPQRIGVIVPSLQSEFFVNITQAVKSQLNEKGYDVKIAAYNMDAAAGISIVENYIVQNVDLIIAMVQDQSFNPSLEKAMDQGIKVLAAGVKVKASDTCLLADNKDVGEKIAEMAADFINDRLNGKANVVAFVQTTNVDMADRSNSMIESLKKMVPGVNIVGKAEYTNVGDAAAAMENFLQRNPDIKVGVSYSDGAGIEALEAIKAAGKAGEDFAIFGCDATNQALKNIKEGSIFRGTVYMGNIVENMVNTTVRLMNDDPTLTKLSYSKNTKITKENVDQFLE